MFVQENFFEALCCDRIVKSNLGVIVNLSVLKVNWVLILDFERGLSGKIPLFMIHILLILLLPFINVGP